MIKRKLKLVGMLLTVAGAFCLASCSSSSNADNQPVVNSTDIINDKAEKKQKYVIELNMDNYLKYIDIKVMPETSSYNYYFEGSLSYAFYDNVVIGYTRASKDYTVYLSTGGYARYYSTSRNAGTPEIKSVSGKVIYWI